MNQNQIIENFFAPKSTDIQYTQEQQLKISLICRIDSYKFSHPFAYPDSPEMKITAMSSYGEARIPESEVVVPFGFQMFAKKYLTQQITIADIDAAEAFTEKHFGRKLFARKDYEKVVNEYNGYLPLIIRIVPEGTVIRGSMPIYTVTVLDPDLYWMSAAFETPIQRAVWYPTTIATRDYNIKQIIKEYYEKTGANMQMLSFSLHDFGGRGVSCAEQAEIGGASHLVNFMGSDTVEGILAANFYYKHDMAGYSVYATEHSIEISFGPSRENEIAYIRQQLDNVKALGLPVVSIVLDGYDVYRAAEICCTVLKDEIINCGAKVVFRPDSGDMLEVVPKILKMQEAAFGYTITDKGFKQIKHVGIIQGDGVNDATIVSLLGKITSVYGYSADCVVFGSGGALLQKVNRDTLKFAQKACAIMQNGEWIGVSKDPITDPGKRSKQGLFTLAKSKLTGELKVVNIVDLGDEYEDIMQLSYHCGKLYNETTLDEVRQRVS